MLMKWKMDRKGEGFIGADMTSSGWAASAEEEL